MSHKLSFVIHQSFSACLRLSSGVSGERTGFGIRKNLMPGTASYVILGKSIKLFAPQVPFCSTSKYWTL